MINTIKEGTETIEQELFKEAIQKCLEIVDKNIDIFTEHFPHVSQNLIYKPEENKLWTSSFFVGMTYLSYVITQDKSYLRKKEEYIKSFSNRCKTGHMATHDIGFLYSLSSVALYQLTQEPKVRALALEAADKLCIRYHENGKYIQAWGSMNEPEEKTRIIIDCMMNLPLLYWATEQTGNEKYKEIAINHATTSIGTLLRVDGSTYHTYYMDVKTGKPLYGATHQGHRDESTWARGQGWSIYGYSLSYGYTKEEKFLEVAKKSADYFLEHIPLDYVTYWDFDFSDAQPDIRDTSAASLMATGLLELAKHCEKKEAENYMRTAKKILFSLMDNYMNKEVETAVGLLREGMYHRDNGFNEYTIWGDYFFLEALYKVIGGKVMFW